ncbi:hypothetical protein [uncultured Akkermansia sp.]|nr:hypothetical protein [uncultured Akkermansia sp.]
MNRVSSRIRKTVPMRNGQGSGLCRLPGILSEKEAAPPTSRKTGTGKTPE